MGRFKFGLFVLLISLFSCNERKVLTETLVVPVPKETVMDEGVFTFSTKTTIAADCVALKEIATQLSSLFIHSAGFIPKVIDDCGRADIVFVTDSTLNEESYSLKIIPDKIQIKSSTSKGAFYAMQTLRQLLPAEIESKVRVENTEWLVPALTIEDTPRFAYRGLMLDVSRNFLPKENVMKIIELASMLKINKFHFHLVDDQGWRLEIKKYPKLTEVGAWRVFREGPFSLKKNPTTPGEETPVGGFYTQEEIKEIIAFAADRQIEVIPEIEMPAHSNSALSAYPQYTCPTIGHYIAVLPGMGGLNSNAEYCVGNDSVYVFLQNVLDEVIALFPSKYIHLGGDEALKEEWKRCPKCRLRMQQEQITNVEDLQGYFMTRVAEYVKSKDRIPMGWDEWTNSKVPDGTIIFGWRGLGDAGYKAALEGHKFVMTPSRLLYLDYYQGPQWFEPRTYFPYNTLQRIYDYEPIQEEWKPEGAENLLGIQASLWTEFVEGAKHVEYMIFPRLAALADIAWAQKETKDWTGFLKRLDSLTKHWDYMGVNYAKSMFNLDHCVKSVDGKLNVSLSCIRPDVEIRYTLDNTDPMITSELYMDSVEVSEASVLKAAVFRNETRVGEILTLNMEWNNATGKNVLGGKENPNLFLLTNGVKGTDKHTDFEWCGWYDQDVSFTLDLGSNEHIQKVSLGHVVNYGMGVHYPKSVTLSVSDDNKLYKQIGVLSFTQQEIFKDGIYRDELIFHNLSGKGRYVKFDIVSPGATPEFHHRAGQGVWLYFDEIEIE